MAASHYSRYVQSMVAHGGQRIADINWLFTSVDASLRVAQKRLNEDERKRAMVSLQHAKNLCSFLQKSLGDLPDPKLVKHLDEFFLYVDTAIDSSLRLPLDDDLTEMRTLVSDLHRGWSHLVSPIRGHAAAPPDQVSERS